MGWSIKRLNTGIGRMLGGERGCVGDGMGWGLVWFVDVYTVKGRCVV